MDRRKVRTPVVAGLHHSAYDPDPHQTERPHPDMHQCKRSDPDSHQADRSDTDLYQNVQSDPDPNRREKLDPHKLFLEWNCADFQ